MQQEVLEDGRQVLVVQKLLLSPFAEGLPGIIPEQNLFWEESKNKLTGRGGGKARSGRRINNEEPEGITQRDHHEISVCVGAGGGSSLENSRPMAKSSQLKKIRLCHVRGT